jgi:amidase
MDELVFATASELADGIRRRRFGAVEVLDAHLVHIARHNPVLNAIVTLDEERARRRARDADAALARGELWGPLHGVPFTIKDSIETAGVRTTSGFPPLSNYVPAMDAPVVARLRAAGGTLLGKTNVPVLTGDAQADNPIFGRTNNPWDLKRTPGGSTGGGAAAVAAGLSPLELGSDIGGSVRIPAHYCGISTIQPTENCVPLTGHIPGLPGTPRGVRHMSQIGPLARSVEDLILTLPLIAGPDGQRWEVPPVILRPAPERTLRSCRLAWTDDFGGATVSADTKTALSRFAARLQELGVAIEQQPVDGFNFTAAWETWGAMFQAEHGSTMSADEEAQFATAFGGRLEAEAAIYRGFAQALNATMRQYTSILTRRDGLIADLEAYLAGWDALLCPVTIGPAFPHCPAGTAISVDAGTVPYWVGLVSYTCPFNVTGHPAVVVPLAHSREGLPIGLQIVGRRWTDMRLLAIAAMLSMVIGPAPRPPGF